MQKEQSAALRTALRQGRPRLFVPSLGQIIDPIVPPSGLALLNPKKLWVRLRSWFTSTMSMWYIRSQLRKEEYPRPFFFLSRWTKEALDSYRSLCEARARSNKRILHTLVTDEFYTVLSERQLKPSNNMTTEWDIKGLKAKVLSLRMVAIQSPDAKFAQMLVRFTSQQTFKVLDKKGTLVAGSASPVPVTEYYVLERPLQDIKIFSWKFMGKLDPTYKDPLIKPLLEQ